MSNDYEGKLLYEARYQELLKEAQGGWLLKAARPASKAHPPRSASLKLMLTLIWAVMAALFIALIVAATVAAFTAA